MQNIIETTQQKFARLATRRVNQAVKKLESIDKLTAYQPTEHQRQQVLRALRKAMKSVEASFKPFKISSENE